MADQIELLKKLQALDAELFKLRREQDAKPRELEQAEAAAAAQEAKVKAAEARLKQLQLAQKEKEGDLQAREGQVRKLQGQLFQVKTNKEYTALQHEIDALKTDNSLLEEAILKLFDQIEQAGTERQREQQLLAAEQERLRQARARIEQALAAIGEQVAQLERQRQGVAPEVPKAALAVYERVLDIRDGLALVPIVNDTCGGCDRRLTSQVVNQVYLKAELVMCEHCNRILYFDESFSKL